MPIRLFLLVNAHVDVLVGPLRPFIFSTPPGALEVLSTWRRGFSITSNSISDEILDPTASKMKFERIENPCHHIASIYRVENTKI